MNGAGFSAFAIMRRTRHSAGCVIPRSHLDPIHFRCFSPLAPHRATLRSHGKMIEELRRSREVSSIFDCPGLQTYHFAVDGMHAGDLGPFPDAVGGVFWLKITAKVDRDVRRACTVLDMQGPRRTDDRSRRSIETASLVCKA